MQRAGKTGLILIVSAAVAGGVLSCPPLAQAATYYVSQSAGNDGWTGESASPQGAAGPWKTLARASTNYVAGDRLLLKCGDTWREELHPQGSGTSAEPITIGSYGNGPKPVIDREDDTRDRMGIHLADQEGYRIVGLEFARCMTGIYAEYADGSPTRKNLRIEDCYFHDSRMYQKYEDYPEHKIGLGICLFSHERHNRIVASDIVVRNCVFRRLASALWTNSPDNFNGDALNIWNFGNLTVEGCLFEEGDQWPLGLRMVDGGVIRNCVTHDIGRHFQALNGVAGAMLQRCRNFLIEDSEWGFISVGEKGRTSGDGEAFDFETSCTDIVLHRCLFHDAEGPGILICNYRPADRNSAIAFENCVFNGKAARVGAEVDLPRVEIFNNTADNEAAWKTCRFYLAPGVTLIESRAGMTFSGCLVKNLNDACSTPNLARQAAISASSEAPGSGAGKAIDGNTNTCWRAASTNDQWLQIEFPSPTPLNEFMLREDASSSIIRYAIECWDDSAARWVVCFKGRGIGPEFMAPIVSRATRKVRLHVERTLAGHPAVTEFGAYNDTTSGPHEHIAAAASASSEVPGHEAAGAADGKDTTFWQPAATNGAWLQLDFGAPATINELRIQENTSLPAGRYVVESWNDTASRWEGCFKFNSLGVERRPEMARLTTRRVRLSVKPAGANPGIAAFEAYYDTRRGPAGN